MGQRITGMTSGQATLPVAPVRLQISSNTASRAPGSASCCRTRPRSSIDIAIVKTIWTDAINHDPAITFIQSGFQQPGRPSMGAWVSYGLGSENRELPAFVVLISQQSALNTDQPLFSRLWGSGFLPSKYQGVQFRSSGDPVLYLVRSRPASTADTRRECWMRVKALNAGASGNLSRSGDRDAHLAVRDGVSDADLRAGADGSFERTRSTFRDVRAGFAQAGTYAAHCLLARRLARTQRPLRPALQARLGSAQRSAARSGAAMRRASTSLRPLW